MDWSNEKTLALIRLYKDEPCLWDPTDPNYKLKAVKFDAWKKISSEMECGCEEIRKKMDSVMSSFRRERAKCAMKNAKGDEKYQSTWFAYKHLSFLLDKYHAKDVKIEENVCNLETTETTSSLQTKENHPRIISQISTKYPPIKKIKSSNKRCIPVCNAEEDSSIEEAFRILKHAVGKKKDSSSIFGEYVASKHRAYNKYTKNVVEHLISNILFEADMGKYNETAEPNYSHLSVTTGIPSLDNTPVSSDSSSLNTNGLEHDEDESNEDLLLTSAFKTQKSSSKTLCKNSS